MIESKKKTVFNGPFCAGGIDQVRQLRLTTTLTPRTRRESRRWRRFCQRRTGSQQSTPSSLWMSFQRNTYQTEAQTQALGIFQTCCWTTRLFLEQSSLVRGTKQSVSCKASASGLRLNESDSFQWFFQSILKTSYHIFTLRLQHNFR